MRSPRETAIPIKVLPLDPEYPGALDGPNLAPRDRSPDRALVDAQQVGCLPGTQYGCPLGRQVRVRCPVVRSLDHDPAISSM
jgi:hypothetical protein